MALTSRTQPLNDSHGVIIELGAGFNCEAYKNLMTATAIVCLLSGCLHSEALTGGVEAILGRPVRTETSDPHRASSRHRRISPSRSVSRPRAQRLVTEEGKAVPAAGAHMLSISITCSGQLGTDVQIRPRRRSRRIPRGDGCPEVTPVVGNNAGETLDSLIGGHSRVMHALAVVTTCCDLGASVFQVPTVIYFPLYSDYSASTDSGWSTKYFSTLRGEAMHYCSACLLAPTFFEPRLGIQVVANLRYKHAGSRVGSVRPLRHAGRSPTHLTLYWGAAIVSIGLALPLVVILMGLVVGATSRRN
ncbi:hypothetical protein EDB87DRAFT_1581646 [Lactarius vividus]|nr:hypothetical protein EDB87DRAFT_1581646 [Lactarius vividus]